MEEKKKRLRPTWAQVRELESVVSALKAQCELQQSEVSRHDGIIEESASMSRELTVLRGRVMELEAARDEQVEATSRQVQECYAWRDKYRELEKELSRLRARGFWSRVFNR